jgi:hypothetical protein
VLLTSRKACGMVQLLLARTRVDGKQFIDPHHDLRCRDVLAIQLYRLEEASSGVLPTCGMHHARSSDMIVDRVTIGLQNAFELFEKLLRSGKALKEMSKMLCKPHMKPLTKPPSPID